MPTFFVLLSLLGPALAELPAAFVQVGAVNVRSEAGMEGAVVARLARSTRVQVLGEDRGWTCLHLPNPKSGQENPLRRQPNMDDGVDEGTGKGTSRVATGYGLQDTQAGTTAEADLLRSLLDAGSSTAAGDLGVLLLGPMARGAEVSLR